LYKGVKTMNSKVEMNWKVDWLTLSLIPRFSITDYEKFYNDILEFLGLGRYKNLFVKLSGGKYYKCVMRYNDISIKIPDIFNADVQGFGIEFTGHGIDYYLEVMHKIYPDYTSCNLLSAFLFLADGGHFTCNVSRCDIAIDDISYEEKKYYRLDLGRIERALKRHEFATRLTCKTHYGKDLVPAAEITNITRENSKIKGYSGKTIYIGNSKSNTHIRIYDKLAERKDKGFDVDPNIKHWARFELVYKNKNALAMAEKIVELSGSFGAFEKFLSENINYYIRFVVVDGKPDVSHMCRYKSKPWWVSFVGTVKKSKLVHIKPDVNEFNKKIRWIKRTVAPTLRVIHEVVPMDQYLMFVNENSIERNTPNHDQIVQAYIEAKADDENVLGLKRYENYTNDYITFIAELERNRVKNEIKHLLYGYEQSEIDDALKCVDENTDEEILKYCDYKQIGLFADDLRSEDVAFYDNLRSRSVVK